MEHGEAQPTTWYLDIDLFTNDLMHYPSWFNISAGYFCLYSAAIGLSTWPKSLLPSQLTATCRSSASHPTFFYLLSLWNRNTTFSTCDKMYEMQPQPIEKSSDYVQNLHILIHSRTLLQKRGYVLENLTKAELDSKKRCDRCLKSTSSSLHVRILQLTNMQLSR